MLPTSNPIGIPTGAEVQALADTEAGRELELGLPLPLTGVRLARCYLPWVNLALTQVPPPRIYLSRGQRANSCFLLEALARCWQPAC